jgi:hypothetical protein
MKLEHIILTGITACLSVPAFAASIPSNGIITAGGAYSGTFNGKIQIQTTSPVTLTDVWDSYTSTPMLTCVTNAQVTVTQSIFLYRGSIPSGGWTGPGQAMIFLSSPASVYFANNDVDGGSGVGAPGVIIEGPTTGELDITANKINNCWTAVQLVAVQNNPSVYIKWNQVTGDALTERSDQINIYESTGVAPNNYIYIYNDFVEHDPDAPQKLYSGEIVVDIGSQSVIIDSCYGINGGEGGIGTGYSGANTGISNCYVLGLSYTIGDASAGIVLTENSGSCTNCTSGFWNADPSYEVIDDYRLHGQGSGNTALKQSAITLQAEEDLYYTTFLGAASSAGVTIGKSNQGFSGPTFPNSSDFNF